MDWEKKQTADVAPVRLRRVRNVLHVITSGLPSDCFRHWEFLSSPCRGRQGLLHAQCQEEDEEGERGRCEVAVTSNEDPRFALASPSVPLRELFKKNNLKPDGALSLLSTVFPLKKKVDVLYVYLKMALNNSRGKNK